MKRLIIAACLVALGCGSLSACVSTGPDNDVAALDQIVLGTSMAEVVSLLGEPDTRVAFPNGQAQLVWLHSTRTADARPTTLLFNPQGRFVRIIPTNQTIVR